ncbi:DUF499 domain-containing protein [Kitasatospora sp. NPDC049258]|uniref:DUF499 domain-containing protein n=1 Tax=Kitasatospora sp. NPDC049258 TaxID=3155394 RepID=UPI00342F9C82
MSSSAVPHWADVLALRPEVKASDGSIGELQMSLHKAVYQTVDVPYRKVDYYVDITQPTPNLVGFFGRVARRLGTHSNATALFHLDQGMGGGKSHALVGLFHMANSPAQFFATELGGKILQEAEQGGVDVDLSSAKAVVLTADYFSPGKTNEIFGPATSLFERFIWSLVDGDMDRYQRYIAGGPDKGTLQQALMEADRPVLILLDELMDYVLQLSDASNVERMPGEKAFLNALMDACDDVPRVAFVLVMIRSEFDERGYPFQAQDFRAYVSERLVRNGTTAAVTESQDFASIIQRRLFANTDVMLPTELLAQQYITGSDVAWREKVFDKLGPNRELAGFSERMAANYPFHPDLMRLVREEWSHVQNFQRVRSTVAIFARTALHWVTEHQAGRWAPGLIGVGDIPLTVALEQVLSSGLLMNNDRAIQGYRSVATTDVTSTDGASGRAVTVDARLRTDGVTGCQAAAAVRMASALFCYSIVNRPRGGKGATKAELLAAIYEPEPTPGTQYTDAEEVFNALTGDHGLGALEVTAPSNAPARYYLSIKQTLRMYFTAAVALVKPEDKDDLIWEQAQRLGQKGTFDAIQFVGAPAAAGPIDRTRVFEGVDSPGENRLVVLDPRRWTLLNGKDTQSRAEITSVLGLGPDPLRFDNSASCVVACVNTQRRAIAQKRAAEVIAWRYVVRQLNADSEEELREAQAKRKEVEEKFRRDIERAYQHYAYLVRAGDLHIEFKRFDDDSRSSLRGDHVWTALVEAGRATQKQGLSGVYLETLLDAFDRTLTPREVVQSFYKNPSFPLVPSTDEIRRVVFDLVQSGWEFIDADGEPLAITSPAQVSINSIQQSLRRRPVVPEAGSDRGTSGATLSERPLQEGQPVLPGQRAIKATELFEGRENDYHADLGTVADTPVVAGIEEAVVYKRYRLEMSNKSVTSPEAREAVWQLFRELAKVIDTANPADHQLLSLNVTLTTAEGHQGGLEDKTKQAGGRVHVEDDDF